MGWQDRDYNRGYRGGGGLLMWLWRGSVPLFHAFGIEVRAHAILVVVAVLGVLFGLGPDFGPADRLTSVAALFTIVLLHEFGHCFACRYVGGDADQIIMHPLGGLALCAPPHRPLAAFITVAGGPAVNVLICLACGIGLALLDLPLPPNPFNYYASPHMFAHGPWQLISMRYLYWIYQMSYSLLVFNLIPVFPLDGGQMLQAILWPHMGFYKSMKLSCEIGMFVATAAAAFAIAFGPLANLGLVLLAAMGFYTCYVMRLSLMAQVPGDFESLSFAIGPGPSTDRPKKSWLQAWREKRADQAETIEALAVDKILEKVARTGMNSLTGREKRTLQQATESQRRRDQQRARRTAGY